MDRYNDMMTNRGDKTCNAHGNTLDRNLSIPQDKIWCTKIVLRLVGLTD